ncbi:acetate/propionate family kinase [Phenylobacterium sp. LjRoot219]|uniref:acetate/propionate family kinase n=1 Tax=Phenylobacterium sp. LjRoot219 TaxID=3342283 RepID=UPI003ECC2AC7
MNGCIAVINAGSSSIKFAIYEDETALFRGRVEGIGASPRLRVADAAGAAIIDESLPAEGLDHGAATRRLLETAVALIDGRSVLAVGHRVVHGGVNYAAPVRVDRQVLADLAELTPLAPLHQPHNLASIAAIAEAAPHIPQVACFDTAFHRGQPDVAQSFALPRKFADAGVRRYGFHGLSYEYIASRLPEVAPALAAGRVIVAHLGNGASLCAIQSGRSMASTMGFTAVDGLVMGTRCGTIDPGVLIYLMDVYGMDARALETLIYRQSGLLGVSGVSSDMRTLHASAEPAAAEAVALFVYRIVREAGSLAAALGGVDGVVFTAGIGENDPTVRSAVAAGCGWLGLELDEARNRGGEARISSDASRVAAWVIPTDEERMVARHTEAVLGLVDAGPKAS